VLWESREVLKGPGRRCASEELLSEPYGDWLGYAGEPQVYAAWI
jgi:hypothetical protein